MFSIFGDRRYTETWEYEERWEFADVPKQWVAVLRRWWRWCVVVRCAPVALCVGSRALVSVSLMAFVAVCEIVRSCCVGAVGGVTTDQSGFTLGRRFTGALKLLHSDARVQRACKAGV